MLVSKTLSIKISGLEKCMQIGTENQQPSPFVNNSHSHHIKWMAPEVIKSSNYSAKSDVWSFAVTIYEIMSKGSDPWANLSTETTEEFILRGATLNLPSNSPKKLQILVDKMMSHEISRRPTFFQTLVLLNEIKKESFPSLAQNWDALEDYDYRYDQNEGETTDKEGLIYYSGFFDEQSKSEKE